MQLSNAPLTTTLFLVLFSITSAVNAAHAQAAKKNKRPQPEVYSSVEPGVVTVTTTTAVPLTSTQPFEEEQDELPLPPAPTPVSAPVQAEAAPAPQEAPKAAFDPVPSEQAPLIAKRLPLVEKIMVKHGRAYDYRTHTVKQLQTILAELDSQKSSE